MEAFLFLSSLRRSQALMRLLGHRQTYLFEYFTVQDTMVIYNKDMTVWRKIEHYLGGDQSIRQGQLRPEDSWQIRELLTGSLHGPMELRGIRTQGEETVYEVDAVPSEDEAAGTIYLGYIRDITLEKAKEKSLRQQAQRDSLTLLYNNMTGKALIDQYLREKDPYASCGLLVIDVDFFKNVNDRYGHLFGDKVLQELAHLLQTLFSKKDILVRAGGDEFLVFLKVYISERIPPNASGVTVSASEITYGQTLNESKLTATGTMKHPGTGEEVKGTFAWKNGTVKPDASDSYEAEWTFTPAKGYEEYAPTTGEVAVKVNPKSIEGAKVALGDSLTYKGSEQTQAVTSVKLDETTLTAGTDYTISGNTGKDAKGYELTISGTGNYTGEVKQAYTIARKAVTATVTVTGSYTYTGKAIEPTFTVEDEGTTIPASEYTVSYENNTNAGTAKIILKDNDVGNYIVSGGAEFTIDKAQATCTPPTANDLTYNGTAQQLFGPGSTQDGTLVYSMHHYGGYVEYGDFCATSAKNYTIWYKVMGDSNHTMSEVNSITVTIKPAPLTVTAKDRSAYVGSAVPTLPTELVENTDYTVTGLFKEDKLTKTPKLSYVATPDMSKVGEFVVNISEADAGSNYTITYVPGKLTITTRPSSGGSGNTGTKTDTVKNPDGSTTKTETKADGSKTETTTATTPGGSTGSTVTKTDTKGNTTTEASAKLSDRDVKEAQEKGEAVTVPVKGIAAAKDANAATKIKIDVPNDANKTTVEIPVENVTSGTVAVIVHEDGTEELVKDSKPTEHGVQLELSGSTTVKIIDNSKTFDDTKDHWSRDEVNFVAARELFNGVGGNQFGVSQPMTRGMVNTVLARLADVDTTPGQGQAWYEVGTDWAKKNGISDGTNPTAPVTREQLATLLYRYAGSPSVSGTLHAADAASVSDYAEDALLWANQNGIVNGVGSNTIAPKDNAQRAQVAAMLARYLQNQ